jgi:hypothetical protein
MARNKNKTFSTTCQDGGRKNAREINCISGRSRQAPRCFQADRISAQPQGGFPNCSDWPQAVGSDGRVTQVDCRQITRTTVNITTIDVARSVGLDLRPRGTRWWTCCPLHSERIPSFCIFPDGRWKCFGCGKHGDAVDLYAALYNVSIGEALRAIRGDVRPLRPRKPTGSDLRQKVEEWKSQRWHEACIILHAARVIIAHAEPDSDHFWNGVAFEAWSTDELNALAEATPGQLVHWMNREARP